MKTEISEYQQQAIDFAKKHGIKLFAIGKPKCKYYFDDDKQKRYVFKLKLTRNNKGYTFTFGQSVSNGAKMPTMYDVLTCLTKYDPDTFEDFCSEFGYDTDSRRAVISKRERYYANGKGATWCEKCGDINNKHNKLHGNQ